MAGMTLTNVIMLSCNIILPFSALKGTSTQKSYWLKNGGLLVDAKANFHHGVLKNSAS